MIASRVRTGEGGPGRTDIVRAVCALAAPRETPVKKLHVSRV